MFTTFSQKHNISFYNNLVYRVLKKFLIRKKKDDELHQYEQCLSQKVESIITYSVSIEYAFEIFFLRLFNNEDFVKKGVKELRYQDFKVFL